MEMQFERCLLEGDAQLTLSLSAVLKCQDPKINLYQVNKTPFLRRIYISESNSVFVW
jgi:hypothetical protein